MSRKPILITVSVLLLVQPNITYLSNQTASEFDDQVTLTCQASGDPTPTISWSFGNKVFTEGEQVELLCGHAPETLFFPPVNRSVFRKRGANDREVPKNKTTVV